MNILHKYKSNIFLTGSAGTGKSYIINEFMNMPEHKDTTLLCASTGTAAVNINGTTVHRLFSIPVPAYGTDPEKVAPSKLKVFAQIDTVIIDEISMLRCDAFSFAMKVLSRAEKLFDKKIRVIVVGDFSQLPPIVKSSDESYFTKYGFDKSGFAFTTKEWQDRHFKTVVLEEVKRQSDQKFIHMLSYARTGNLRCLPYFNQFVSDNLPEDAVYICGTNSEADKINKDYVDKIEEIPVGYQSEKHGSVAKDLPCDDIVLLKKGCRVMFTANDSILDSEGNFNSEFGTSGRYTNGLFATVKETCKDYVIVELDDGTLINVTPYKWSFYSYTVERSTSLLKKKEIGWIKQIPLKIAKAITIHKSQGKTFDKVILSPKIFADGQLYVALSRVTSPNGLVLTEPIIPDYFRINATVKKFYANDYCYEVPESRLKKIKEIEKKQRSKAKKKTKGKASSKKKKADTKSKSTKKKTTTTKKKVTKNAVKKRSTKKKNTKKK